MATLKILRQRLKGLTSTKKITAAMKVVSSSKLRRSEEKFQSAITWSHHCASALNRCLNYIGEDESLHFYTQAHKAAPFFFLLTSDRGLCGGFNLNITREFRKHAKNLSDYHYGVLGQKGKDILLRFPEASFELQDLSSSLKEIASLKDVQNLVQILLSYRSQDVIGDVYVIRSRFRNIMASQVVIEPLLPFSVKQEENTKKNYGFMEPSSAEAIKKFLAYTLSVRLWTYVCESHTCEQAARMMAMDQANRNAKDLIQRLELRYNRTRQSQITRELIEVMSAAESLSSRS